MKMDYGNSAWGLKDLSAEQQALLVGWSRDVLVRAQSVFAGNSYTMTHDFEREPEGFYVTNGMFKGAMRAAGFRPVNASELNWRFRVKPSRELDAWEKDKLLLIGRGWLVRDRWREKGDMVAMRSQRRRILECDQTGYRERRLKL